jgi:hypothetical protein
MVWRSIPKKLMSFRLYFLPIMLVEMEEHFRRGAQWGGIWVIRDMLFKGIVGVWSLPLLLLLASCSHEESRLILEMI